jgi:O-antigen biosynthesis protein
VTGSPGQGGWSPALELPTAGGVTLISPAAVRIVDLDEPLADLWLPLARTGEPYRSLLAVARVDGEPLGSATFSVGPEGRVSRELLEFGLLRGLDAKLAAVAARRTAPRRSPVASVSVVVTTCCDPSALARCLGSIFSCDYDDFEVIVVENRPGTGATRRMLAERFGDAPGLRYVEEPRPGLSRARNAGLEAADGELVAFTDDDTVVDAGWIRRSVEGFERSRDIDCVTGLILPLELETESQLLLDQFAGFGKGFERRTYRLPETRNGESLYPYAPGTIGSGANTVVRRAVARELGGFDSTLGAGTQAAGGEDLDLYIRLLLAGHVIAYEPSAIVWHEHPDGPERLRRQVYRYGVGLGATLTKQLLLGPARLELLRAAPAGVRYASDPGSRKNVAKSAAYPRRLDWLERAGMLAGPFAYLLSASATALRRRRERSHPSLDGLEQHVFLPRGRSVKVASFPHGSTAPASPRAAPEARALPAAAMLACIAAPLTVALGFPAALRLPAVLALLCLAPGAALVKALHGRAEPGLVVGASLGASVLIAQSMLWLGAWWPETFLYLLSAVCLSVLAYQRRAEARKRKVERRARRISPEIAPHLVVIAVAMVAWAASVASADLGRMAGTGLLGALPPSYFLAFALLLVGIVVAVSRPVLEPRLLGIYMVALIVVLHGTTPLLYDEPRYPWVFPHLGVINSIAEAGAVDRDVDIYNNWPGFLALGAWLTRLTGLAPAAYAEWAQVFFNLANVAALRFALRGMTGNERLLWTAAWFFVLGNWVAQDYLAPQAFAFVLALVILGLALRAELRSLVPRTRPGLWFSERIGRLRALMPHSRPVHEPRPTSALSPWGALVVGGVCYLAVVVSHQLTPVVLIAAMTALALIGRRVPLWVPAAMALVEVAWLTLAWPYLGEHYALFDPDPGSSAAPAGYELGDGLSGLVLVAYAGRVELLLLGALAVFGLARRLGARRWDLAAAILLVAPLLIVGMQSYGGEGRYRFYLFALPWLCFFAAAACWPTTDRRLPSAPRPWRVALATGVLGVCILFAYYGLELANRVRPHDVDAVAWFERHAPPNSLLVGLAENFPRRLSARYPDVYDPVHPGAPALLDRAAFRGRRLRREDVPRIAAYVRRFGARHTYLILTSNQERLARLYGLLPPGSVEGLNRALRASTRFRPVYTRGDAAIFRYRQ